MPPLPVVPNVVRVTHKFALGSDIGAITRLHFGYTGAAPSNSNCAAFATAAYALAVTNLIPLLAVDNSLEEISFQDLSSASGGFGSHSGPTAGTRSGELLGAGTAVLLSMAIARRYRGGKPRAYWPFGTGADLLNANTWNTTPLANFLDGINDYQVGVDALVEGTTTLTDLVNVSYYEGFTSVTNPITGRTKDVAKLRVGGPVVDTITGIAINPKTCSQRRRNQAL